MAERLAWVIQVARRQPSHKVLPQEYESEDHSLWAQVVSQGEIRLGPIGRHSVIRDYQWTHTAYHQRLDGCWELWELGTHSFGGDRFMGWVELSQVVDSVEEALLARDAALRLGAPA